MANKSTTAANPPTVQPGVSPAVTAKPMNPLLASYLASLATRPLFTKCCTSGTLSSVHSIFDALKRFGC